MPSIIRDAPFPIDSYQDRMIVAFWQLSSCRGVGMALGPIPWSDMHKYAECNGYADCQVEYDAFVHIMQKLDEEYMSYQQDRTKADAAKAEARAGRGSARSGRIR